MKRLYRILLRHGALAANRVIAHASSPCEKRSPVRWAGHLW